MLKVVVHSVAVTDRDGAQQTLTEVAKDSPRLQLIWADMGYRGKALRKRIEEEQRWKLEIVKRPRRWDWYPVDVEPPPMPAFTVLKIRWVVERTFTRDPGDPPDE